MKPRILPFFFFLNSITAFSQVLSQNEPFVRCLSLQMTGKTKNINFFEGDNIEVKLYSDSRKHNFQMIKLTDSSFFYSPYEEQNTIFDLQEVKFKDIKKIYLSKRRNLIVRKGSGALGGAGVILFTVDILNQIKNGMPIKANPTLTGVSAGLIGLGFLIKILANPNYRINKRHFFRLYHLPYNSPLLKPS